jgi:uncharacterized protein YbbC (DUF1343 family)
MRRAHAWAAFAVLACAPLPASAAVRTGLDVLESRGFEPLKGKKVGLITNLAAVNAAGERSLDVLRRGGVTVAALFSPEHGFTARAGHGQRVDDGTVEGIPFHSLYGVTQRPTAAMLAGLDALVFDMPDAGARFYTYITTLAYALEEAAARGLPFVVLDRPNPAGGETLEGDVLDPAVRHFTAYYSVPVRHGMTTGELARWHALAAGLKVHLTVVPLEGWKRSMLWDETGLPFVPPSPNIRTPRTALLYPGIGAFEATNVAVGRGTDTPFEVFGAPWFPGDFVASRLNGAKLAGMRFEAVRFTPATDRYAGEECSGVRVVVTDPKAARPVDVFVHAACLLREASPADFQPRWAELPRVTGSAEFERLYKAGTPAAEILASWTPRLDGFRAARRSVLLYR